MIDIMFNSKLICLKALNKDLHLCEIFPLFVDGSCSAALEDCSCFMLMQMAISFQTCSLEMMQMAISLELMQMAISFQTCSLEMTCESEAVIAATLANGGVCPTTDKRLVQAERIKHVLSLMLSCGLYNYSGMTQYINWNCLISLFRGCLLY